MKTIILSDTPKDIQKAGKIISGGGLVAFPTETVYGLGANALDENAVKKIYAAKGRPCDNPLIVHISKKEQLDPLVKEVGEKAKLLVDKFFPGPLTIILKKSELINNTVSGGLDTVAVRMPENKIANSIIAAAGVPVAAPSANTSGLPSPTRAKYVIDDMNGKIDAILDGGDCKFGVESTVITLAQEPPTLLRPGAITKEMIESVIGEIKISPAVTEGMKNDEAAPSPGMKYKHYAPKAKVVIVNGTKQQYEDFVNSKENAFALCFDGDSIKIPHISYGKENDDLSQARELFDSLRKLDEMGAKKVYARIPNKSGVGLAVYNRLIRAAAFDVIDMTKPFFIGLTGQSGSGKSYVAKKLGQQGFKIIDCDKIVKDIYESGALNGELSAAFGGNVISGGRVDRAELAKTVFSDSKKLSALNKIVHPAVIEKAKALSEFPCVLDAPQLFEAGMQDMCANIISVVAPHETIIKRIAERDGISRAQANDRIKNQHSAEFFKNNSDFVIYNDNDNIDARIDEILKEIY